jgi:hypothetical protein
MKLHNIIAPLSENDDDMFPGVAPSVFDDAKAKDQPEQDTNDVNWIENQIVKLMGPELIYKRKREKLLDDMNANGAREYFGYDEPPSNVIPYHSFDWFKKINLMGLDEGFGIKKTSPYLNDIENIVMKLQMYWDRENVFKDKKSKLFSTKMDMTRKNLGIE